MEMPNNIFQVIDNKLRNNTAKLLNEKQRELLNKLISIQETNDDVYLDELLYTFYDGSFKNINFSIFFDPDTINMREIYLNDEVKPPDSISFSLIEGAYSFRDLELNIQNMQIEEFFFYVIKEMQNHFRDNDFAFMNNSNYELFDINDIKKEVEEYKVAKYEGKTLINMLNAEGTKVIYISFTKKIKLIDGSSLFINKIVAKDKLYNIDESKYAIVMHMDDTNKYFNIANKIILSLSKNKVKGTENDFIKQIYNNV